MTRQMIPNAVITRLTDKPEISVYQNSGHASWVEVNDDGTIRIGPTASEWTAYQNSGGTLNEGAPLHDSVTIDWAS